MTARPRFGRLVYHSRMKLYTRTGDDGTTGLFDGSRAGKDSTRIELCGQVDELSSFIGHAATGCHESMRPLLLEIQRRLFDMGADLATPSTSKDTADKVRRITSEDAAALESHMDRVCAELAPMKHFILPGGSEAAARLHLARAVCRRVERRCVAAIYDTPIGWPVVIYLNRLSDLLFALARQANQLAGVADVPWLGREGTTTPE